jgi:hypothetical protein
MVYIPFGILCIALTLIIINGLNKSRDNKRTNRSVRNAERFNNTISVIKSGKEKDNPKF